MEIVRFFGSSGAGKETLIKKIFDNPHYYGKGIINPENNIIISNSSINYIGQSPNDPCIKLRSNIIDEVIGCNFNDSILIKGQNIDLKNNIPNILINLKKDATHKIVFLTTIYKNLLQRCRKKVGGILFTKYDESKHIMNDYKKNRFNNYKKFIEYRLFLLIHQVINISLLVHYDKI